MDALSSLLNLSDEEKAARGLQHTPREIAQQPATWLQTAALFQALQPELERFLSASGIGLPDAEPPEVWLIGAGTSDYIGRALCPLLRRQWKCEVHAVPSTDLVAGMDDLLLPGRRYLWVSFSRSGESPEGVAVLRRALQLHTQVRHLIVTCSKDGAMARIGWDAEHAAGNAFVLPLHDRVNDRSLAMTSSFSNMVVAGQCLAHFKRFNQYEPILRAMNTAAGQVLPLAAELASLISFAGCTRACFVGSGALRAVAIESSLKVTELTAGGIVSFSESTLGLRHGPMSAIDEQTLFVLYLSRRPDRCSYDLDLLAEIAAKKLGKIRAVVAPDPIAKLDGLATHPLILNLPANCGDEYRPPLDVIFGQLLGLFSSIRAGLKPDCPSPAGIIHRTVANVKIYG